MKCPMCKEVKNRSEFYNSGKRCKVCDAKRDVGRTKTRYNKRRTYFINYQKEYYKNNADKVSARVAVKRAVQEGKLKKEDCYVCGGDRTRGHHPDYSKPLNVVWLCQKHHQQVHSGAITLN